MSQSNVELEVSLDIATMTSLRDDTTKRSQVGKGQVDVSLRLRCALDILLNLLIRVSMDTGNLKLEIIKDRVVKDRSVSK